MPRRALVFQHMQTDDPKLIGTHLAADGFQLDVVHWWRGETAPFLQPYDLMLVLGGPQQVWQEDEHRWLAAEKEAIREWVADRARPYIGICFGHQLLADALGGTVQMAPEAEIGLKPVRLTPEAAVHPFFAGLGADQLVMQWHYAEVTELPPGAVPLATSAAIRHQAFAIDSHALAVQFHFEWTLQSIRDWVHEPTWIGPLEEALGKGGHSRLVAEAAPHMPDFNRLTGDIYANFRHSAGLGG